ncbi:MAG: DUF2723 domain-containing protein [Anaerolineae bacterium]|nr:DUF2723 domain-containing protein [Anaerolineae bacterium]
MENRLIIHLKKPNIHAWLVVSLILLAIYATTMQTIPNGSGHYFMIDVGETQLVLNLWGSLHSTGYPLYVILGNILTSVMRFIGISPIIAPAIVSLIWGMMALTVLYILAYHYTKRAWLSAVVIGIFGLVRSVWIHQVIAEIYTFGLLIGAVLLLIALWKNPIRGRIYWLAFIGGIGVAHHRAIAMMIPALLFTMLPYFWEHRREMPKLVIISLLLGCIGFGQYLYMYLRGIAGGAWVYGEPQTLEGVWIQFIGLEASRFIGTPSTPEGLRQNFELVNSVLNTDLSAGVIFACLIGLMLGLAHHRHLAIAMMLNGLVAYLFHVFFYTDVLSALILPVLMSLIFGLIFAGDYGLRILENNFTEKITPAVLHVCLIIVFTMTGIFLVGAHRPFIQDITTNPDGIKTINMLKHAPDDSVVMVTWGPNHFAAGIGRDLTGELAHLDLVDHKADYAQILAENKRLITPDYTFYTQPPAWWEQRIGQIYPVAVAPNIVEIKTVPIMSDTPPTEGIIAQEYRVVCDNERISLYVTWVTGDIPTEDLSVFVHGLSDNGNLIAQGDQPAPVYLWRPMTTWVAGEMVTDVYPLVYFPHTLGNIQTIRFGLYRIVEAGFENVVEYETAVDCEG